MKIVVSIGGQKMECAVGEGNNSNLPALKSSFRGAGGDEQAGHVRKPSGFEVDAVFGDGRLLHGPAGDVHDEETAEILGRGLDDGNHDGLAIGGPGKSQAIGENFLVMEEIAIESTIAPGDLEVGSGGIVMPVQVGKALAVGRKGDAAVARGSGCYDLLVAASGNMTEPEGLQTILVEDVEQVFSVGRNSGQGDVTVVGEIFGRHS